MGCCRKSPNPGQEDWINVHTIKVKWFYTENKHIQLNFKYTTDESEVQKNNQNNISPAGMWGGGGGHVWFALLLG